MDREVENFLQAEETALKIVETLKKLKEEASSYQAATDELELVRQKLAYFIESTEKLAKESHGIINMLSKIGVPEIINKLEELENRLNNGFNKNSKYMDKLKKLMIIVLTSSIVTIIIGLIIIIK